MSENISKSLYHKNHIIVRMRVYPSGYINIWSCIQIAYRKNKFRKWANNVRSSHTKRGYDVSNTSIDYLENLARNTSYCPICGIKLVYCKYTGVCGSSMNTASCDRISNETYLSPDNIWIICKQCNAKKFNQNIDECRNWCEEFLKVTK